MRTLLRLLAVSLALAGCSPQQTLQASVTCTESVSHVVLELDADALLRADALSASLEAVQRRINDSGVQATAGAVPPNRLCVEAPGFDAEQLDRLADLLTKPGVLTFNLVDEEATHINPGAYQVGVERNGRIALPDDSLDGQLQVIFADAIMTDADFSGATQEFDERNQPSIGFSLHPAAVQRFGRVTSGNVGRPFAIVLDDRIVSAPMIVAPIMGGSGQITGSFTIEEAEQMAIVLRSGALPAGLTVIEKEVAK